MTSRRLVVVLPDPPLPFGNAAARWFWVLLRGLADRGHDLTTYVVYRRDEERAELEEHFSAPQYGLRLFRQPTFGNGRAGHWTHRMLRKWRTVRKPYSYIFSDALRRDLASRLVDDFDVLHLEQLWTGWLGWHHASRSVLNVHYLFGIDLGGVPRSIVERARQRMSTRAEHRLLRHFPTVSALTPRLARAINRIAPQTSVYTVPLALDLPQYPFTDSPPAETPVVTLIGSFDWYPTYAAGVRLLTRIWPLIQSRVPAARLQLVGRGVRRALGDITDRDGIAVHEDVPDILPYFAEGSVMVYAPGPASGMKVKILEAFALGLPVVTTPDGVEGIPAQDGVHAGIAEDDESLAARAISLLTDGDHARRVRGAARTLVETHCNADRCLDAVEAGYDALLHR